MDQSSITIKRLIEELRGELTSKGINATRDQSIALNQANETLDELEDYNLKAIIKAFGE